MLPLVPPFSPPPAPIFPLAHSVTFQLPWLWHTVSWSGLCIMPQAVSTPLPSWVAILKPDVQAEKRKSSSSEDLISLLQIALKQEMSTKANEPSKSTQGQRFFFFLNREFYTIHTHGKSTSIFLFLTFLLTSLLFLLFLAGLLHLEQLQTKAGMPQLLRHLAWAIQRGRRRNAAPLAFLLVMQLIKRSCLLLSLRPLVQ